MNFLSLQQFRYFFDCFAEPVVFVPFDVFCDEPHACAALVGVWVFQFFFQVISVFVYEGKTARVRL